jgi:hypothetical protein
MAIATIYPIELRGPNRNFFQIKTLGTTQNINGRKARQKSPALLSIPATAEQLKTP